MNKIFRLLIVLLMIGIYSNAQENFPVNGINDKRPKAYLFKNATIVVDYKTTIKEADLYVYNDLIKEVGKDLKAPDGAIIIDLEGKYIYPSLIDIYTNYGVAVNRPGGGQGMMNFGMTLPQVDSNTKGAYNWNEAIKSWFNVSEKFVADEKTAAEYRKLGFGSVLSSNPDGLARGSSALVTLSDKKENELIIDAEAAAHYSFNKGSSRQSYPSSLFGIIALLRQTYIDADWYHNLKNRSFYDQSLDSWNMLQDLPQIFEVNDKFSILRAVSLGNEFNKKYIIKGNGDEYQRIKEIKETGSNLIIPLVFPKAPDVKDPFDAMNVTLETLKHWELAPANPAFLQDNDITFALTLSGLKSKAEFWPNLRKAIDNGLNEESALKALTYTPAEMLEANEKIGALKKGMLANFIITSGNIFKKDVVLYENWIKGKKFLLNKMNIKDNSGIYDLSVGKEKYVIEISGKPEKPSVKLVVDKKTKLNTKSSLKDDLISISFNPDQKNKTGGDIRLSGWISDKTLQGTGQLADGSWIKWNAVYKSKLKNQKDTSSKSKEQTSKKADKNTLGKIIYPFLAYGMHELPEAKDILIKNATIWTNENQGILKNTDVLVKDGKIALIGTGINSANASVIDGKGKHLSAGIIDEHSHIAGAGGLNEGSHSITSEVRVGEYSINILLLAVYADQELFCSFEVEKSII